MTAVEWLEMEIVKLEAKFAIQGDIYQLCEQAKGIEKQQIIEAYDKGQENPFEYSEDNEVNYYDGNNYYNETFKN